MREDPHALSELLALADELLEEAAAVRQQWAELAEAVGAPLEEPEQPLEATEPPPAEGEAPPQSQDDVVRLVVLDMMLSGRSEDETRDHVRSVFGVEASSDVIDEVFRGSPR